MGEPARVRVTWDAYKTLPDDGIRYEVLDGELVMTPAPGFAHQMAVSNIHLAIGGWIETSHTRGALLTAPFDVVLADDSIVQPDLVYLSEKTLRTIVSGRLPGPPDIAMEVFHRKGEQRDTVAKHQLYARYGVPEYWHVNLDARTITILELSGATYKVFSTACGATAARSRILVGLTILPATVFKGI